MYFIIAHQVWPDWTVHPDLNLMSSFKAWREYALFQPMTGISEIRQISLVRPILSPAGSNGDDFMVLRTARSSEIEKKIVSELCP